MAIWPFRGQQAPDFWDDLLKVYIDAGEGAVSQITAEIGDPDSGIATALNQTIAALVPAVGTSVFSDLIAKADANNQDVSLLILSDSTAASTGGWVDQAIPFLAARFPALSISYTKWVDGSPGSYSAPTVTAGSGTHALSIYNASVAGKTFAYHTDASRWATMIAAVQADAVIVSLGHNDNIGALQANNWRAQRGRLIGYLGFLALLQPQARIVLGSQNYNVNYPLSSQFRADMLRTLARELGYGFVDICKAFTDTGDPGTLISGDGTHPNASGYALWAARFMKEFPLQPTGRVQAQPFSIYTRGARNFVGDPTWLLYTGTAAPVGWTLVNTSHARDVSTAHREASAGALSLTKVAGGSVAYAQYGLSPTEVKGRTVTAIARVYVPSGSNATTVQVAVSDGARTTGSETVALVDQFSWLTISAPMSAIASAPWLRVYVDASNGATLNNIIVDRVGYYLGDLPADPATSTQVPNTFVAPDVQVFTAGGTWTNPAGATMVQVTCIAPGGGGGSGARQAPGTAASGGAGGGGGGLTQRTLLARVCGATELIQVGAPVTGGASVTTDSTVGSAGGTRGPVSFGAHVKANGGTGGAGGTLSTSAATGGAGGAGMSTGGTGSGATGGAAGAAASAAFAGGAGGGSGGGISATPAAFAGGAGGGNAVTTLAGGTAGAIGATGSDGASAAVGESSPGGSGGGGGSSITDAGGAGGAGGNYGAGGGGGGASLNGNISGAGGAGGAGLIVVVSY